jgi:hypothetical protein
LEPVFSRLTQAFEAERLAVADDAAALEPEQILVLEFAGELMDFMRAVERIEGLEFLAEHLEDKVDSDEEFTVVDNEGRPRRYNRQLFLIASDHQAWQEVLSLWQRFKKGEAMPYGLTKFRDLFSRLKDLRPWDDRDRLEYTGVLGTWERELDGIDGNELIAFEAELWMRRDEKRRDAALVRLRADLEAADGALTQSVLIEEIGYHGILGMVPASLLREVLRDHEVRWMKTEGIRFFHAVGQIAAVGPPESEPDSAPLAQGRIGDGDPRVALLDGVPLANHRLLADRIRLDDPDEFEGTSPVERRIHGTSMASLIIHGDINEASEPLIEPLYIRPILTSEAPDWVEGAPEELPRDRLPVDLINIAVARLFEGDEPAAPKVNVIVLAVGDRAQQFNRFVSPLARLIDWLSLRYGVLFLVAAGNHMEELEIPADTGLEDPQELQHELLCAIQNRAGLRRVLSPAESINSLTVGASHSDHSEAMPDDRLDGIITPDLPSPISAMGAGIGRAIKPDVLIPGGRQLIRLEPSNGHMRTVTMVPSARPPGAKVAAPGAAGDLGATTHVAGTSVATAIAGHRAGRMLTTISELRAEHDGFPEESFDPLILKAALAHGAAWGTAKPFVIQVLEELQLPGGRDGVARFVGYGNCPAREPLICDSHRVTVLAAAAIGKDEAHAYRFPLPGSLSAQTAHRRVTLTLAWLTPINPFHRAYRRAALKLEPGGLDSLDDLLGDRADSAMHSARRGTLQHEVHEGDRAVPFSPGSELELSVSCRAAAGTLDGQVPYAALVTIEVPEALNLPIYQEVRQALRPQVPAARPRAS